MKTEILQPSPAAYEYCAKLIRSGEIVAFPTETVYGLGASAYDEKAVDKIYAAKGRPSDNPLIVHVCDARQIEDIAYLTDLARTAIAEFMPGPMTIILPKKSVVPYRVSGGLETVGVRMPDSLVALEFIRNAGVPICAPSANISGRPSPTTAKHVFDDLCGKIPAILDGGACRVGVESTIIDLTRSTPRLLRAGGMPLETIESKLGKTEIVDTLNSKVALCPGMKYKHYSPKAEVYLAAAGEDTRERILRAYKGFEGKTVVVCLDSLADSLDGVEVLRAGNDAQSYAHNLFSLLRECDELGFDTVIAQGVEEVGYGRSVLNRLIKAAGGKTV
jgi:L-threonylcarbamoyladenylate synthase